MVAFLKAFSVVMCITAGLKIVLGDGDTPLESHFKDKHKTKRAMVMDQAMIGLLAWRKLLWNAKPGSTHPLVKTLKSRTYFKAGDFSNALKDFTSAVPDAKMTYGGKRKGNVYTGNVGDRIVILRQRGRGFNNFNPTIEIIQGQSSDMVYYMGKKWKKVP